MTPDRSPSRFAVLVRHLRKMKGMSQAEVADRGGFARGYLGLVESGKRGERPARDTVMRVAQGLIATPEEEAALLQSAGFPVADGALPMTSTIDAIRADPALTPSQRQIMIDLYRALTQLDGRGSDL